jgi:hypothetical protein
MWESQVRGCQLAAWGRSDQRRPSSPRPARSRVHLSHGGRGCPAHVVPMAPVGRQARRRAQDADHAPRADAPGTAAPAGVVRAAPPAPQQAMHRGIGAVELPSGGDRPEVPAPTPGRRIRLRDDFRHLPHSLSAAVAPHGRALRFAHPGHPPPRGTTSPRRPRTTFPDSSITSNSLPAGRLGATPTPAALARRGPPIRQPHPVEPCRRPCPGESHGSLHPPGTHARPSPHRADQGVSPSSRRLPPGVSAPDRAVPLPAGWYRFQDAPWRA